LIRAGGCGTGDAQVGARKRPAGGHRGAGRRGRSAARGDALRGAVAAMSFPPGRPTRGGDPSSPRHSGVDVEDDVEVVVRPLRRAHAAGDVPRVRPRSAWRQHSGLTRRGWVACGAVAVSPAARRQRGRRWIGTPGNAARPARWPRPRPGQVQANRGAVQASRMAWRSAPVRARGWPGPVRHRCAPGWAGWPGAAGTQLAALPRCPCMRPGAISRASRGGSPHWSRVGPAWCRAPSESFSKSA